MLLHWLRSSYDQKAEIKFKTDDMSTLLPSAAATYVSCSDYFAFMGRKHDVLMTTICHAPSAAARARDSRAYINDVQLASLSLVDFQVLIYLFFRFLVDFIISLSY